MDAPSQRENFNHRNTLSILRINPPKVGGGLKFEPDAGIGQKGAFCKGLKNGEEVPFPLPLPELRFRLENNRALLFTAFY